MYKSNPLDYDIFHLRKHKPWMCKIIISWKERNVNKIFSQIKNQIYKLFSTKNKLSITWGRFLCFLLRLTRIHSLSAGFWFLQGIIHHRSREDLEDLSNHLPFHSELLQIKLLLNNYTHWRSPSGSNLC